MSVFGSFDRYAYDQNLKSSRAIGWNNLIANLGWTKETDSGWKWEANASHNEFIAYQDQTHIKNSNFTRLSLRSALMEESLHAKTSKEIGNGLEFQSGVDFSLSVFKPGVTKVFMDEKSSATSGENLITTTGSMHGQISYHKGAFNANAGLRATLFMSDAYKTCKPSVDLLASYELAPRLTVKATYDHAVQFFHSLEGIPTGWSMQMLVPATEQNKPESADQAWAGIDFSHRDISLSVGGFYKSMKDLVFFANASSFFNSAWKEWQYNLESGTGHSYGLEILTLVNASRFSGQLSYTLSKTDRVFPSQNANNPIPFKFDRRHMLNMTGEFKIASSGNLTHSLTGGLSFMSGH